MDPFEFADLFVGGMRSESETGSNLEVQALGVPQKVSGTVETDSAGGYAMVSLGGSSVTEDDGQAIEMPTDISLKAGDEVAVEIVDGKPRVVGRIGWGDELQGVADEALAVAQATGQYFWHDDSGAHVSTEALEPEGASNSLWNSLGLLIRKAANNLVSITQSAIAFYDGLGNSASNIVASFGSSGFQVGRTGESHLVGDYHSMQLVDREGSSYFDVADLRDESGNATITDSFAGDGATATFYLGITAASTSYTVKRNGTTVTSGITKTATDFTFSTAPAVGASITATYTVTSQNAKYYTLGTRGSGNVGGMSVSEGSGCVASGFLSHAEGDGTTASGYYTHAENSRTTASGNESHAEGLNTKATGRGAHAEGYNTTASGQYSHGEGLTTASGGYSHSEGRGTTASGDYSHAEGYDTTASASQSHAEGNTTVASGTSSHAQNWGTVAASQYQTAMGRFNVSDSSQTYALIVGNGTSSVARSNAMTVDWDGAVAGLAFNGFRGRRSLTTTDDIDALFETGVYYIQGNGAGGTFPSGTTGAYNSLISVGGHPSTESADSWVGKQIFIAGSTLYVRSYAGSPRAWSAWGEHKPYSAPTQTSTASSIFTPASGVTVTGAYYTTNGIMAQVYLTLSRSSAIAANTEVTLGTVVDGKRPKQQVNGGFGTAGSQYGNVRLLASGDVRIRATAQIAASTSFTIIFPAYMLP